MKTPPCSDSMLHNTLYYRLENNNQTCLLAINDPSLRRKVQHFLILLLYDHQKISNINKHRCLHFFKEEACLMYVLWTDGG